MQQDLFHPNGTRFARPSPFTLAIWFVIPVPDGVTPAAWHLLALFIGTIAAIIGKAMPIGALAMIAIALVAITGVTDNKPAAAVADALSGFSNPLIWLIGFSIMISRGLIKTGLGARIGYFFIRLFGKKTLGIGYALGLSELVLAPVTPSNTARGGGIMHPIMRSHRHQLRLHPRARHAGSHRSLPGPGQLPRQSDHFRHVHHGHCAQPAGREVCR